MKINIFSLVIFFLLTTNINIFAKDVEINLSKNNELKCRYILESKENIIDSNLYCKNYIDNPKFIEGWDQKKCKSQNYKFKTNNQIFNKVAIYCLTFDEKEYIQVF